MGEASPEERAFMEEALRLAALARGRTSPNPMVGAVLVRGGEVVGRGYHARAGEPHAEVLALREAGERARGATLYVNLEPCSHFGRTPPCAPQLVAAGVAEVAYGMVDPNPRVAGRGLACLREGGVRVRGPILEEESRKLNEFFVKYATTGLPFVLLKAAISLDGKIATRSGDSRWVTGEEARALVHELRDQVDAVLVGVGTVLADDPLLAARPPGREPRTPLRVVLDSHLRTPASARVLTPSGGPATLFVASPAAPEARERELRARGAEVWRLPERGGRPQLEALLRRLGEREVASILVEGGSETHASFWERGLVDKALFFIAPKVVGGREAPGAVGGVGISTMAEAHRLERLSVRWVGEDLVVEGYPKVKNS
ncbi:MAG: bifunctional diaminohydroxyphosphoribosylaminopyrimidine deaminase/5-amino-6-(5-phosphoribosylamino)uracil reductase RibD [Nitrospinota bacterium]